MNYMAEINAFHRRRLSYPLSARAMALWFVMMDMANSAHWTFPMFIRELTLRGDLNFNHEQFIFARRELIDNGYIIHEKQAGNQAAKYYIVSHAYKKEESK